jgi:hypothetical protein
MPGISRQYWSIQDYQGVDGYITRQGLIAGQYRITPGIVDAVTRHINDAVLCSVWSAGKLRCCKVDSVADRGAPDR